MSDNENLPLNVLGIGTDIVECLRIAQMIERHGDLFINRVYTPLEIDTARAAKPRRSITPVAGPPRKPSSRPSAPAGDSGISPRDVEVRND